MYRLCLTLCFFGRATRPPPGPTSSPLVSSLAATTTPAKAAALTRKPRFAALTLPVDLTQRTIYSIPNCDHHVTGKYQPCSGEGPTPACKKSCESGYTKSYNDDMHFGSTSYSISAEPEKIATEIMTNGPVEAAFTVYEDFLTYKSGVYKHTTGNALGGHAIKIIGW